MSPLPPYRTAGNALRRWDIPEQPERNHIFHHHSPEMLERIRLTKPGAGVYRYRQAWVRLHADRPAPTVMGCHGGVFIHPWRDRCLSPRELAVLQDFPASYVFVGSKSDLWRQIGNAVPVGLGRAVGMACFQMLAASEIEFSFNSKMPCPSWGIPSIYCKVGDVLRTIPGTICRNCYTCTGRFIMTAPRNFHQKHLEQMLEPNWVPRMVKKFRAEKHENFRWMDVGDLQTVQMLEKIVAIAEGCKDTIFWLPTRELGIIAEYIRKQRSGLPPDKIWPANLTVRLSATWIDGPAPVAFAQRYGCVVSRVTAGDNYTCSAPKNSGKCGDCRACWQRDVFEVVFHLLKPGGKRKSTPPLTQEQTDQP